ncbi:endonuclease/exonuclease/phosphatase family protein [Curvibacter sp. CHRR-16]|uniref:endonuclease/exonuclease/phosphatase family protein n=1 Tax=Curvibacter sp. CHRR-16 TaxID=2835872 RepID=UPI001BD93A1D|nr:endonuclease/exonuclease/phosphatase family protein [Curvibacter sp. CHRR-16]MBT0569294.1 endonuclease/exonuclease/phosphatase family protein [Curvibacter sp. CHRR-16]
MKTATTNTAAYTWKNLRLAAVGLLLLAHLGLVLLQSSGWFPLWLSELSLFVPYYWVLPLLLLAPLLAVGLHWSLGVLALASLLWFATSTMGMQWNMATPTASDGTRLRVMTYNVKARDAKHRANGFEEIENEVRSHQPDVVALQDANGWLPERSNAAPIEARPLFGLPNVVVQGQYVLASRYPLQQCETGLLTKTDPSHTYLRCSMQVGQQSITVATAHFVSPRWALTATKETLGTGLEDWKQNVATRMAQAGGLVSDLIRQPRPLLVLGDLNSPPNSEALALVQRLGLRDAFNEAGKGWGFTHGHSLNKGLDFLRIDHILTSAEFAIASSTVGGSEASQHNPVVAEIVLKPL